MPYSGHSAAAEQAGSSAKVEEWALYARATAVMVDEAMKGLLTWYKKVHKKVPARNVSWHFPRPGASVDPIPLYLSLLLVLRRWNCG